MMTVRRQGAIALTQDACTCAADQEKTDREMLKFRNSGHIEDSAEKMKSLMDFFDTKYKNLSFEEISRTLQGDFPDCDVSEEDRCYFTYKPYQDFDFVISANPINGLPPIIDIEGSWKFSGLALTSVIGGTWFGRIDNDNAGEPTKDARQLLQELKRHYNVKPSRSS